jgi:hypothetical protein
LFETTEIADSCPFSKLIALDAACAFGDEINLSSIPSIIFALSSPGLLLSSDYLQQRKRNRMRIELGLLHQQLIWLRKEYLQLSAVFDSGCDGALVLYFLQVRFLVFLDCF